jgi:hypothetical protein
MAIELCEHSWQDWLWPTLPTTQIASSTVDWTKLCFCHNQDHLKNNLDLQRVRIVASSTQTIRSQDQTDIFPDETINLQPFLSGDPIFVRLRNQRMEMKEWSVTVQELTKTANRLCGFLKIKYTSSLTTNNSQNASTIVTAIGCFPVTASQEMQSVLDIHTTDKNPS